MRRRETMRPYTVPTHAPDSAFVECYRWDIAREPRLLAGLRRDDGSLYLERGQVFTRPIVISYPADESRVI